MAISSGHVVSSQMAGDLPCHGGLLCDIEDANLRHGINEAMDAMYSKIEKVQLMHLRLALKTNVFEGPKQN